MVWTARLKSRYQELKILLLNPSVISRLLSTSYHRSFSSSLGLSSASLSSIKYMSRCSMTDRLTKLVSCLHGLTFMY